MMGYPNRFLRTLLFISLTAFVGVITPLSEAQAICLDPPGDATASGITNVVDVQCYILTVLHALTIQGSGSNEDPNDNAPACLEVTVEDSDVNCDGNLDVVDVQLGILHALDEPLSGLLDANGDQCVDACVSDADSDNDGVADADDLFPNNFCESSDADGDGIGDNADPDDDNDGVDDPVQTSACNDNVGCTDDLCDPVTLCSFVPNNANCDNGLFCDGTETWDATLDCQAGTAPSTDDGVACTVDGCDENNDVIINSPNDENCDNGLFCDGAETCDATLDCQPGTAPTADDGIGCTDDSCDEVNDVIVNAVNDGNCDNGLACDGLETCDAVNDCQPGNVPNLDDGVACTIDTCDPDTGEIIHIPSDANCDNGLFCDGAEFCDAINDCQPGTPPEVNDGVGCTDDSCDEDNDVIVNTDNDANCDNGLFCDGTETCDATLECQPGTAPITDDGVAWTEEC